VGGRGGCSKILSPAPPLILKVCFVRMAVPRGLGWLRAWAECSRQTPSLWAWQQDPYHSVQKRGRLGPAPSGRARFLDASCWVRAGARARSLVVTHLYSTCALAHAGEVLAKIGEVVGQLSASANAEGQPRSAASDCVLRPLPLFLRSLFRAARVRTGGRSHGALVRVFTHASSREMTALLGSSLRELPTPEIR
jgi:hypothetical protein